MLLAVLALVGCDTTPPPPPEPEKPACDLALDAEHLAGKSVVRLLDGETEPDLLARGQFFMDGDTLKIKYNTRALTAMYTYTCKKEPKEITCMQDEIDAYQWCQTLWANKGSCSTAMVADATGLPVARVQKDVDRFQADVKKLDDAGKKRMKVMYSQPNNQLRGVLHVKFSEDTCRLSMRDNYQTFDQGQLREMENVVGSARFVPTDRELVFEHCKDARNFVALTAPDAKPGPGETKIEAAPSEVVNFRYVGPDLVKAEPNCSYSMDFWSNFEPVAKGTLVTPGDKGALTWEASQSFDKPGRNVVHLYRYKDCGQGSKLDSVSCQVVMVKQ
jgi:hypothetical protein